MTAVILDMTKRFELLRAETERQRRQRELGEQYRFSKAPPPKGSA